MYYKDKIIPENEVANCFANYFEKKVEKIVRNAVINREVYNCKIKLVAAESNFINNMR